MAQIVAGDPIVTHISHLNGDETPILGETWTVVKAEKADKTTFDPVIVEEGNGVYELTYQTVAGDPYGDWYVEVEALSNGARYYETIDVLSGRPQVVIQQAPTTAGITRRDLRRQIARNLGDFYLITATAVGDESHIVSEQDLALEYGHFVGMQVVCVEGTAANVGYTGTVTVSSQQNRSVSFVPPMPLPTNISDVFEMYNKRGTGWRMEEYNAAINAAIQRAGEEQGNKIYTYPVPDAYTRNSYITIPDEFSHFSGVEIIERDGRRRPVVPNGLTLYAATREVYLNKTWADRAHGRQIRLIGYRMPGTLETDDARTDLGAEWIIHEASAQLLQKDTAQGMTQGGRDRLFYLERQGADGRRPSILTTYLPNTVKL